MKQDNYYVMSLSNGGFIKSRITWHVDSLKGYERTLYFNFGPCSDVVCSACITNYISFWKDQKSCVCIYASLRIRPIHTLHNIIVFLSFKIV